MKIVQTFLGTQIIDQGFPLENIDSKIFPRLF